MKISEDVGWSILQNNNLKQLAYGDCTFEKTKDIIKTTLEIVPNVIKGMKEIKVIIADERMIEYDNGYIIYRNELSNFIKEEDMLYFKSGKMTAAFYISGKARSLR